MVCSSLQLDGNKLHGSLPSMVIGLDSLTALSVAGNILNGSIPAVIRGLYSLQ